MDDESKEKERKQVLSGVFSFVLAMRRSDPVEPSNSNRSPKPILRRLREADRFYETNNQTTD